MENLAEPQELGPGSVMADRYEILEILGFGNVGEVFRAFDRERGHEVAIKVIHERHLSNRAALARFVRGATLAYELDHPGIVRLYESHNWNGKLFYTMEYIKGKTLRHWLYERKKLDFGSAVRVLCLIADALDYAHKTTVHRDVSPENIMVLPDGSVRLLDFGLAKHDDNFKGLTTAGTNLGKVRYMAPEQELNAARVDRRADIFSLGIILFEMLVGYTPLEGRPPVDGRKLRDLCPDLPPDTDIFMRKVLAGKPAERFSSAREFRDGLLELWEQYKDFKAGKPYKVRRTGILGFLTAPLGWLFGGRKKKKKKK